MRRGSGAEQIVIFAKVGWRQGAGEQGLTYDDTSFPYNYCQAQLSCTVQFLPSLGQSEVTFTIERGIMVLQYTHLSHQIFLTD
jgi:hypothetical protein